MYFWAMQAGLSVSSLVCRRQGSLYDFTRGGNMQISANFRVIFQSMMRDQGGMDLPMISRQDDERIFTSRGAELVQEELFKSCTKV